MDSAPLPAALEGAAPPAVREPHAERMAPHGIKPFLSLLWGTVFKFFSDGCAAMAAALSFYTFFSLPALLTLLLGLIGRVMDPKTVQAAIVGQVGRLIGAAGADQVRVIIENGHRSAGFTVATLVSLLALGFGATTAFAQLQEALNKIWGVKPDPRRNQLHVFMVKRIFSFGVVITVGFLLLVSLVLSSAIGILSERLTTRLGMPAFLLQILFAVMFRYLPDARIAWRDVRAGSIGSALLYTLGKVGIGLYLGGADPGNAYGAAGSLAIVLIWVYYTSMVLLLGAEFTEQWAERYGRGVRPEKGAVSYVEEERRVVTA
jgi:membrane protein